jgi:thymidylate synthase ThyX
MPVVQQQVRDGFAQPADWTDGRYAAACRAQACDLLRYLLPAATMTNIGVTLNARALEHMLTKLYSSDLAELRQLAGAIRPEAEQVVPTLLKYAGPSEYLRQTPQTIRAMASQLGVAAVGEAPLVRLVHGPAEPLADLAAAILYEHSHLDWETLRAVVAALPAEEQQRVADAYVADRGKWDQPLRALEHLQYTFEITLDYGAFRDIQRHRMATQTGQTLTIEHGYETPPEIVELGHGEIYHACMAAAAEAFEQLAPVHGEERAQYVVPLAYRKRVLFTWNLRELHHFISLRSGRQGHRSYRQVAQQCWQELNRIHPHLARQVRVDLQEYGLAR